MDTILIRLLSSLSKATLDPGFGGRGMALSRVLSLATRTLVTKDPDGNRSIEQVVAVLEKAFGTARQVSHEEWNEIQAMAESAHWFLRADYPQVSLNGAVEGGYVLPPAPAVLAEEDHADGSTDSVS